MFSSSIGKNEYSPGEREVLILPLQSIQVYQKHRKTNIQKTDNDYEQINRERNSPFVPFENRAGTLSRQGDLFTQVQFSSVAQSSSTFWGPKDCSTPDFPVHHQLPELAQTLVQSIEVVIPSNHLILCRPLLLLPSVRFT